MCVWLPGWPIQRLRHDEPALRKQPLVLYAPASRSKMLVTACSPSAARHGVVPGMPLAEARALVGGGAQSAERGAQIHFALHHRPADRDALRQLTGWCQRFSPLVAVEEAEQPDSLLLDITGCGPLFGGEEALAMKVVDDFRRCGYWALAAIADTIGAAWAVAHYGVGRVVSGRVVSGRVMRDGTASSETANSPLTTHHSTTHHSPLTTHHSPRIVAPGGQADALYPFVVEALRLSGQVLELLREFDIRRIGQLLALPRADLCSRFQRDVVHRLDQALGNVPELLTPERPDEPVEASWLFEPPAGDRRTIEAVLGHLVEQVLERLRPRQMGVQGLLCSLETTVGQPIPVLVGLLQSSASTGHLMELLRLRFERIRVPAEVSAITVRVVVAGPLEFHQGQLFEDCRFKIADGRFEVLIERLSNRLGEKSVLRPRLWPDAQPEFACRYEPWISAERGARSTERGALCAPRSALRAPPCLMSRPIALPVVSIVPGGPPLRFQWQDQSHVVAHYWGPERIETGWWRDRDVRRDYYLVETTVGKRFWLFRTMADESWFLHGTFA